MSRNFDRLRSLLFPLQILKCANVEIVFGLAWMAVMIKTVNIPMATKSKVIEMNWETLGNVSADEAENFTAKEITTLNQYSGLIRIPLQIILAPLLGSLTDEIGRKPVIVVGQMAYHFTFYITQLFVNHSLRIGLWIYYIQAPFLAVFLPTLPTANAFIADDMQHKKELLYARLTAYDGIFITVSGITGLIIGGYLLEKIPEIFGLIIGGYLLEKIPEIFGSKYATGFLLAGIINFIGFLYSVFLLPNATPEMKKITKTQDAAAGETFPLRIAKKCILHEKEGFLCMLKKRDRQLRLIVISLIIQGAATGAADIQEESLLSIYTLQRPFYWTAKDLANYKMLNSNAGGFCQIAVALVFRKFLKFNYSTIVLLADLSAIGSALIIAVASKAWHIYTKIILDMISSAGSTAQIKIITEIVPPDETGKLLAMAYLATFLYTFIQEYCLSEIYKLTLSTYPRTVWYLLALLATIATVVWFFGHFAYLREKKRMDQLKRRENKKILEAIRL